MNHDDSMKSRREILVAGGVIAATAALSGGAARAEDAAPPLNYEYLCTAEAELEPGQPVGKTPQGTRNIVYVKSGVVTGPKIKGRVLPGGGDWLLVRPDGISEVDVRATIETDDGALIYTHYRGVIDGKTGYFRTTPRYETASEKYAWLNDIVAVGVGSAIEKGVRYHIYQIL
jgi:hypothetical protein